jgi:hypothetical protein
LLPNPSGGTLGAMGAAGRREWIRALIFIGAIVGLPLAGRVLSGRDLQPLFRFPPPLDIPRDYPRFSWVACALVVVAVAAIAAPWVLRACGGRRVEVARMEVGMKAGPLAGARGYDFPRWGWAAVAWTCGWWLLAWTRFGWFAPLQPYTFFPLWLGFIVTLNAMTQWRAGSCLMRRAPGQWAALFGASAVFWWIFEWLNRFVGNWHYLGANDFSAPGYAAHATLCFSTVLPAVAAMRELLGTFRGLEQRCANGPRWSVLARPGAGVALLVGGAIALVFTGARPLQFYPALWAAPLALVLGDDALRRRGLAADIARGDWREAMPWMLAALACGFFWELWNWHSFPKWIYTVPYVDRWHGFEMPLPGYAGYLPFGLECYWVVARLLGGERGGRCSSASST